MHKLFILLLFFSFFPPLLAQNLVNLYQEYLPDYVRYNDEIRAMFNGQLMAKAAVHPDLIYFQIERIHLQLLEPDSALRIRKLAIFEEIEKKYIRRRTEWAFNQIDQLKNSNYHQDIQELSLPYFEKLLVDTKESVVYYAENEFTIDLAKREYFKYIYYTRQSENFDQSLDYKTQCMNFEADKRQAVSVLYKKLCDHRETIPQEKITEIFKLWFIFIPGERTTKNIEVYDLVALNQATFEKQVPFYRYGIGFGYIFNNRFDIMHTIEIPGLTEPAEIFETTKTGLIFLSFNGYIPLNEQWMQFTYLNIELDAGFSASNQQVLFDADYIHETMMADTLFIEYLKFNANEIIVKRRNTFVLRLSTPVYSLARKFFIDLGFGVGMNRIEYELNHQYDYFSRKNYYFQTNEGQQLHSEYSVNDSSAYQSETIMENQFYHLFTLDLRYLFNNGIFINLALNQYYAYVKLGYNF
jgi:hypothetical protein